MDTDNIGGRTFISNENDRVEDAMSGPIVQSTPAVEPLDAALVDEWPVKVVETTPQPIPDMVIEETPRGETIAFNNENVGTIVTPEARAAELAAPASVPALPVEPGTLTPLLDGEASEILRKRWNEVQARFVDEPRTAVQQADALVTDVIAQITAGFTNEHNALENQWKQGRFVSTEDLRMALQRYRSFFNRLVIQ